jgi:hypothetical protein
MWYQKIRLSIAKVIAYRAIGEQPFWTLQQKAISDQGSLILSSLGVALSIIQIGGATLKGNIALSSGFAVLGLIIIITLFDCIDDAVAYAAVSYGTYQARKSTLNTQRKAREDTQHQDVELGQE